MTHAESVTAVAGGTDLAAAARLELRVVIPRYLFFEVDGRSPGSNPAAPGDAALVLRGNGGDLHVDREPGADGAADTYTVASP